MYKLKLLLIFAVMPLVSLDVEDDLSDASENMHGLEEQDREAANILALQFNLPGGVGELAKRKNITEESAINAILWMSEHPQTPMPSTPMDYTREDIETAAAAYKSSKEAKRDALNQLDKQKILKQYVELLTEKEIDKSFSYYKQVPHGDLPNNLDRIRALANMVDRRSAQQKIHRQGKKETFDQLNKQDILKQYPSLTRKEIDGAFTHFRSRPGGDLPNNPARIKELADRFNERSAYRKKYKLGKKEALDQLDKQAILEKNTDLSQDEIDKAFIFFRHEPVGALPDNSGRIKDLVKKYDKHKKNVLNQRKRSASGQ